MRSTYLMSAFCGLVAATPRPVPQDFDFTEIDRAPAPTAEGPAVTAASQPVTYNEDAAAVSASASVASDLSASPTATPAAKRDLESRGVNDPCAPQPDGYGPKPPTDTVDAFLNFDQFTVSNKVSSSQNPTYKCSVHLHQRPNTTGLHAVLLQS